MKKHNPLLSVALSLAVTALPACAAPAVDPPTANAASVRQDALLNQMPTAAGITDLLRRIEAHADLANPAQIVDRQTHQVITDFSTPNLNATVDLGGYPYGVLHAGMLLAGDVTGDKRFTDFTARRFQVVADRLPYFRALAQQDPRVKNSFRNFLAPGSLDACGAWGAAMIKARRAGVGPDLKGVIDVYADYIRHKQLRLPDGTLARRSPQPESVWGDDMYMSIPFLAQMGKLTGDTSYYDDAVRQAQQISARLFDPQTGLYAHGWTANNPDNAPKFYWGRANGWCLMAMVELLDVLPDNYAGRDALLKTLRAHVESLAQLQSESGFWHQLLNKPDSYLETSCTAMFVFSMARAVNRGWISAANYGSVSLTGWNALTTRVTQDGGIEGTCIGTNLAADAPYYYSRPQRDDIHGYGPVLLAGAEMIRLLKNTSFKIQDKNGGPVTFTTAKA